MSYTEHWSMTYTLEKLLAWHHRNLAIEIGGMETIHDTQLTNNVITDLLHKSCGIFLWH